MVRNFPDHFKKITFSEVPSDDHHSLAGIKTVHFHQELVQGLFPLVVAAHDHRTAALPAGTF